MRKGSLENLVAGEINHAPHRVAIKVRRKAGEKVTNATQSAAAVSVGQRPPEGPYHDLLLRLHDLEGACEEADETAGPEGRQSDVLNGIAVEVIARGRARILPPMQRSAEGVVKAEVRRLYKSDGRQGAGHASVQRPDGPGGRPSRRGAGAERGRGGSGRPGAHVGESSDLRGARRDGRGRRPGQRRITGGTVRSDVGDGRSRGGGGRLRRGSHRLPAAGLEQHLHGVERVADQDTAYAGCVSRRETVRDIRYRLGRRAWGRIVRCHRALFLVVYRRRNIVKGAA